MADVSRYSPVDIGALFAFCSAYFTSFAYLASCCLFSLLLPSLLLFTLPTPLGATLLGN